MHKEFTIQTSKEQEIVDITSEIKRIVNNSNIKDGMCLVYVPHATCSLIINENYDPNVMTDIINSLSSLVPEGKWIHDNVDGNGAAHIKSAIIGPSEAIPLNNGELQLGQWQDIMLADFDGPRKRKVIVTIR